MASETVLDYLGRPCLIAEAMDKYEEPLNEARKRDARELAREIGGLLKELDDREQQIGNAMYLAHKVLPNNTDNDEVRALLAMAIPYHFESGDKLYRLAGNMLAALERGKLVEVPHV